MEPRSARLRSRLSQIGSELFGIDLRALAVMRIGLAILILTDLAVRATDLTFFYSDDGMLPRSVLLDRSSPWMLSAHVLSGAPAFQAVLFVIAALCAVALLLGYRTQTATIVSWFLLLSLQNRNPYINQSGDLLLRLILFWGIFLPLGARYSLDSLRRSTRTRLPVRVVSFASVALLAQIVIMYVFASKLKTGADWKDGNAVYYALQYKLLATPRADLLLGHPDLLSLITRSVVWLERFGPLLLFIPFIGAPFRILAVFGFMSFHLGMSTFLALGPFMWVPEVALIAFLPTVFWDSAERHVGRFQWHHLLTGGRPLGATISSALRLSILLPAGILFTVPGASDMGAAADEASPAEREEEGARVAQVAKANEFYSRVDTVVSRYESEHEQKNWVSRVGSHVATTRSIVLFALPGLLLLYVLLLNLRTVTHHNYKVLPTLQWLGDSAGLNQTWSMFAPQPPHSSGWFVIPAHLRNGRTIDLWRGPKPLSWKQPASIVGVYPTERWRKYAENLAWEGQNQIDYARYQCRSWNTTHSGPNALIRFTVYFMRLDAPPPSQHGRLVKPKRIRLVNWFCFGKPKGA